MTQTVVEGACSSGAISVKHCVNHSAQIVASATETEIPENSEREFVNLIDLYGDCPALWKVENKDYFNRNKKKNAAPEKIARALKVPKISFHCEAIGSKS